MIKEEYKEEIKDIVKKHLGENVKIFMYGSANYKENFNDIDVGLIGGENKDSKLHLTREEFENSNIPYKIDLIDFDEVEENFKKEVLNNSEVLWLT